MDIDNLKRKAKYRFSHGLFHKRTFVILFVLSAAADIYTVFRLASALRMPWPAAVLCGAAACLLLYAEMISRYRQQTTRIYRLTIWAAGLYTAFLIHFLIILAAADLAFLIPRALGYRQVHRYFTGAAAAAALLFTLAACHHAYDVKIVREKLPEIKKCGKLRIALLSDLHIGAVIGPHYLRKIVRMTNELHPDLIVITGDLFNHAKVHECADPAAAAQALSGLESAFGTYCVRGNHDPQLSDPDFQVFLQQSAITPLDNRVQTVGPADRPHRHKDPARPHAARRADESCPAAADDDRPRSRSIRRPGSTIMRRRSGIIRAHPQRPVLPMQSVCEDRLSRLPHTRPYGPVRHAPDRLRRHRLFPGTGPDLLRQRDRLHRHHGSLIRKCPCPLRRRHTAPLPSS